MIHPVLLGGGVRLFPDGGDLHRLQLLESLATTKGVLLARYQPAPAG